MPKGNILTLKHFLSINILRKRKIIESGSPKKLLAIHEYMAWIGSVMLLIHAGIHFNALLPSLAIIMLLIAVASGLVVKFLLKKANVTIDRKNLADLAINDPQGFTELATLAKNSINAAA